MQHDDYVSSLVDEDPSRMLQLKAARAAQDFDASVAAAMENAPIDVETLANQTRISEQRIRDLLDGDSAYAEEMLLLCHALHFEVQLYQHVRLHVLYTPENDVPGPREGTADVAEAKAETTRGEFDYLDEIREDLLRPH